MGRNDVLDEVFEHFLKGGSLFQDRNVLRNDYVPDILPHRGEQIRYVGEIYAPTLGGSHGSNILVYGKTGTGKTAVIKYVLNRLTHRACEVGAPIKACYVNCRLVNTEYRVLSNLCAALNVKVPFTGLAVGEVFERFRSCLDSHKILFIIILDEIDALVETRGDTLLYKLTRINENLQHSRASIIGISNDLRFKELLDPRVLSSLGEEEIVFRPYNATELRDILLNRAQLAFRDGVLFDGALSLCAALAAAEHGDARRALDLLRVAGELGEREGSGIIMEGHIRLAEKRIEHDRISEALENLPLHSKLVLCSVYLLRKAGVSSAITGDVFEVYGELSGQMGLAPLTQRRVSSLINELDVIGLLNTRVVSMGRYGRTKKVRLSIAHGLIRGSFKGDDRLERLINYTPGCLSVILSKR
ncbi:MAG: orc1/cdc6 family replication initiation protein [Candidatus Bathyarchaeota archaeon]|nr:MAG: orc1/cdc6 family replication initiation protein [Candidatus Bathyarchaeota archaeon]